MSRTDAALSNATDRRRALVARWYELTRERLPAMATAQRWPIALDHCFMRVCLDAVLGSPWHAAVARPAVRSMSEAQLVAAIRTAEAIVAEPERLPALNARSLEGRRRPRRSAMAPPDPQRFGFFR